MSVNKVHDVKSDSVRKKTGDTNGRHSVKLGFEPTSYNDGGFFFWYGINLGQLYSDL